MTADVEINIHIPRGEARAVNMRSGQILRIAQIAPGGQVVDLTVVNAENPHERLWGSKTAWEYGVHLTTGALLLSTGPWERPLLSMVADTLTREPTARGAMYHDVMAGCCSAKSQVRRYGRDQDIPGCFDVIAASLEPFGVPPDFVQDVFNPFMRTGVADNRLFHEPSEAIEGDYIELRAEMDVVVAMSACQGRSSQRGAGGVMITVRGN
jgi:uncharacterized protein YcgI (DUF1989 family)